MNYNIRLFQMVSD